MSKILVTGATGFIGSHLSELLTRKGHEVIAFDRYNSNNNWGWLEESDCKNDIQVVLGDVRDYDSVSKTMKGCTSVFHLAALVGIPYSYLSPLAYIRTNIEGTFNVLESAKELKTENILITSTSETYGTAQSVPIREDHPLVGQSPYSASKIAADQLALSYHMSFDLPVKIIRPFNTYGPRQSARAIIPTIISQVLNGARSVELGNLSPTRDLTYVEDTCNAFYEIYKVKKLFGDVVNIGMNEEISIKDLVKKIGDLFNQQIKIKVNDDRTRPKNSEVDRLRSDNNKLLNNTDWIPKYSLDQGLLKVIKWMKQSSNFNKYKPNQYNV